MSIFTENEMIFTNTNNKMSSGGYEVNLPFLNNNIPVSYSLNKNSENMFGGLVVPSGLLYLTPDSKLTTEMGQMSGGGETPLNSKLYDKLFQLAQLGGNENKMKSVNESPEREVSESLERDEPMPKKAKKTKYKKPAPIKKTRKISKL